MKLYATNICKFGVVNKNGRVYTKECMEQVLAKAGNEVPLIIYQDELKPKRYRNSLTEYEFLNSEKIIGSAKLIECASGLDALLETENEAVIKKLNFAVINDTGYCEFIDGVDVVQEMDSIGFSVRLSRSSSFVDKRNTTKVR